MNKLQLEKLLVGVQSGDISLDEALTKLQSLSVENLDFARLDTHREIRQGLPEIVFCQGKTPDQIVEIMRHLLKHHNRVLGTRLSPQAAEQVLSQLVEADYDPVSRLIKLAQGKLPAVDPEQPYCMVMTGGTSDIPVAEEAAQALEFFGSRVIRTYDVGVAGVHRLLEEQDRLAQAEVIISVAGMEGALTSVVGGLVSCPVIGVPTSVGYGANFGGISALLAMLNACSPGIAVVNIDNGFGAAVYAHTILRRITK